MPKTLSLLHKSFLPTSYSVTFPPSHFAKEPLVVIIEGVKTGRPSQRISLHQNMLRIVSAKLTKHDKKGMHPIKISRINRLVGRQEVRLHTKHLLFPGIYKLHISYISEIETPQQFKKTLDTTFKTGLNRQILPCVDEPQAAAPVTVQ